MATTTTAKKKQLSRSAVIQQVTQAVGDGISRKQVDQVIAQLVPEMKWVAPWQSPTSWSVCKTDFSAS